MKKEINDLLSIYHESHTPNIDLNEIKKELVFAKKKPMFRFKLPAVLIATLLLIIMIPITLNSLRDKSEPIKPEVLETVYIGNNPKMLSYVKNHFTFYLDKSIYRLRLDDETILNIYYAIEENYEYLIYEVVSDKEVDFIISFTDKSDLSLLKESTYELEHFYIPSSYMDLLITYTIGDQVKTFDISIRR